MASITVHCEPTGRGWTCAVVVDDGHGPSTSHVITVDAADLGRLDPDSTTPDDLVRRSLAFLLEREPKESILGRFDLPVISRYFPDYERAIGR